MKKSIWCVLSILLSLWLLVTGCVKPWTFHPSDNPPPLPQCQLPDEIGVVLVLGGGGARGLAHVGVLEEFEQAGIPIDVIVGCSAGSFVGALYCDCPNAAYVRSILEPLKAKCILDINVFKAWYGLSQGRAMCRTLSYFLKAKNFEELKIPLIAVAADLYSGELITISGGPIIPAVHASCAVPFVYAPVQLYGRMLVDGGVIDPVPVRIASELKPSIIVAIDLRALLDRTFPRNILTIAKRSAEISLTWLSEGFLRDADVVIRPELKGYGLFEDGFNQQIYEAGREAARKAIPQIKELLNRAALQDSRKERQVYTPSNWRLSRHSDF